MKRKIISACLAVVLALCAIGVTACGGHTHSYTSTVTPPNCTEQGYTTHECECGESYVDSYLSAIGEEGHVEADMQAVLPTCSKAGSQGGKECSVCGKVLQAPQVVPATGHQFVDGECENCQIPEPTKGIEYSLSYDGTYYTAIGKGTAYGPNIVIADVYNGLPVKVISTITSHTSGFKDSFIQTLYVPSSVTRIDAYAFVDCSSLSSITFNEGLTEIGNYAFSDCRALSEITIPNTLVTVGLSAFDGCWDDLYTVYNGAKYVGDEQNPYQILIDTENYSVENCEVHPDTKIISSRAFSGIGALKSVTIPNGVVGIGYNAFYNSSNLESVTIPDSLKVLGVEAFDKCSALTYNQSGNINYLGNSSNPYVVAVSVIDKELETCEINQNTKFIASNAFKDYTKLTSITIPNGVINIGNYAFSGAGISSIEIPSSVESLGSYSFKLSKVKQVTFADDCKIDNISMQAFSECTLLESIVIPESVKTISANAFETCLNLTSVTIGSNVEIIYGRAFKKCSKLTSITIPENVVFIANGVFADCTLLTSIIIESDASWKVGSKTLTSTDLSSASTVASYFKNTYKDDTWIKQA